MGAESETEEESTGAVRQVVDAVTPPYQGRPNDAMTTFGFGYFLVLVVVLVPLLPYLVIVWALGKLLDAVRGNGTTDRRP